MYTNTFNKGFDWDKFYKLLVKWIVVSNQLFTKVEVPKFHSLLTFLKPAVGDRMVKGDQMCEKIMDHAEKARKDYGSCLKFVQFINFWLCILQ